MGYQRVAEHVLALPAGPWVVELVVLIFCVEQVDQGRVAVDLSAGEATVQQCNTPTASEFKVHPAHGWNDTFVPAGQFGIGARPPTMREAVGDAAANFDDVLRKWKLGDHNRVIGDVVEFGLEVDAVNKIGRAHACPPRRSSDLESVGDAGANFDDVLRKWKLGDHN